MQVTAFYRIIPVRTVGHGLGAAFMLSLSWLSLTLVHAHALAAPAPGTLDTNLMPVLNGGVNIVRIQSLDGKILVGGLFDRVDQTNRCFRIARFNADGSLDRDFDADPGLDNLVYDLELLPGGKIAVVGAFHTVQGVARDKFAVLNPDGSLDTGYVPGIEITSVQASLQHMIAVQSNGKLIVREKKRVYRLNHNGSVDASFQAEFDDNTWLAEVLPDDRLIVTDPELTMVNGSPLGGKGICRLNPDGSLDTNFVCRVDGHVNAVAAQSDGKILIGGMFRKVNNTLQPALARLHPDGSLDSTFAPSLAQALATAGAVYAIAVLSDQAILIGGNFWQVNGQEQRYLARLKTNGALDTGFAPIIQDEFNLGIDSLAVQADGKIVLGGNFFSINGQVQRYLARLYGGTQEGIPLEAMIWTAVEIGWQSETNALYQVKYATTVDTNLWLDFGSPLPGNGSVMSVFDSTRANPKRFYRILKLE